MFFEKVAVNGSLFLLLLCSKRIMLPNNPAFVFIRIRVSLNFQEG
jgi:hypothetical protein